MAKKKKQEDDINEDFDMDSSGDINEADDNFGLPDVEFEPLDKSEESEESKESEPEQPKKEEVKQPEKPAYSQGSTYQSSSAESEYELPQGESIAPKIITFAILLIIAAGAIWYFGFYKPKQVAKEKARIEQEKAKARQDSLTRVANLQRMAAEKARQDSIARATELAAQQPKVGEMSTISQRTGRYYVIIGSFIDDDIAKDYAGKLGQQGLSTSLIAPWGNRKFYRLAIADLGSFDEAQAKADELKPTYGEGLWVLKY